MNTMQLACFLAVAETLNFARAAEQLHVTQPAVTQQIHSLEAELSVQLFRRTTRTVELTQAGLLFLGDAKVMFEISERAKRQAKSSVTDTREPFVVGCHAQNDVLHLTQPLREMKRRFPRLYPIFQVVPFQHLYQRLLEETVDVVVAFREGDVRKSIHYRELAKIRAMGIVEAGHPLARAGELHLRDVQKQPVIALDPQRCPEDYRKLMHQILGDHSPLDVYFCDSIEACVALAGAGYGVAVAPDFFSIMDPSLVHLPITDAEPISYGAYYKTLAGHPRRRAFVELAKEAFAGSAAP